MPFAMKRYELSTTEWVQICTAETNNVTVDNVGHTVYQIAHIATSPTQPAGPVPDFRTIRHNMSQTLTGLDDGVVLWAMAPVAPTIIEVICD